MRIIIEETDPNQIEFGDHHGYPNRVSVESRTDTFPGVIELFRAACQAYGYGEATLDRHLRN